MQFLFVDGARNPFKGLYKVQMNYQVDSGKAEAKAILKGRRIPHATSSPTGWLPRASTGVMVQTTVSRPSDLHMYIYIYMYTCIHTLDIYIYTLFPPPLYTSPSPHRLLGEKPRRPFGVLDLKLHRFSEGL